MKIDNFIESIVNNLIIILIFLCLILLVISVGYGIVHSQPYITCNPPRIEDHVTKYYITAAKADPLLYNIDPNDTFSILRPIDPNVPIYVQDGFPDPNFFIDASDDGVISLNIKDVKPNISYSLLIRPCNNKACGCPVFLSFVPIRVPNKIEGLRITKENCDVNKYYYLVIE